MGFQVLVAVAALNLGTYAFQLIAAQLLGPSAFGELAAILALVNIIGLPLTAVQIAVGKRVAELRQEGAGAEVAELGRTFLWAALVASAGLLAVYAALLFPLRVFLGVESITGLLLLGASIPAAVLLPVLLGLLQGEQRFREYSVAMAATGALRPGAFLALYFYGLRLAGAVLAIVLASFAAVAIGLRGAVGSLRGGRVRPAALVAPLRAMGPTAVGLLSFTALTNVDLLFAKSALSDTDAGVFGADAFLSRVILYLPIAIFAVMLPRVAARRAAGRDPLDILGRAIVVLVPAALAGVAVLYLLAEPLLRVAFGSEYTPGADELWLFGAAAALFSLISLYLNYDLARGEYRLAYEVAALAGVQVVALAALGDSIRAIVLVDLALAAVGLAYYEVAHRGALPAVAAALAHWRRPVGDDGAGRSLRGASAAGLRDLGATAGGLAARAWRASRVPAAFTAAYAAAAIAATWPVARDMSGSYFGFGNDNLGGIWNFWWWAHARSEGLDPDHSPLLGAPFGFDLGALPVQPYERWGGELLTHLFGAVPAYNILILSSFPLAGLTMYLLADYLLRNRWAAGFAGLIFAFAPFHFGMAMNYAALGSVQFVPLYFLFLARALFERRPRDLVGAILAFGLMAIGSYYYAYYALWITAAVVAVYAVRRRRLLAGALRQARDRVRTARGAAAAAAVGLATVVVVAFLAWKPLQLFLENRESLSRPVSEAVRYSARLYLWFIPGLDHPVFGERVRDIYAGRLYDAPYNEQAMYLGWIPLLLAVVAVVVAVRARRTLSAGLRRLRVAVGFALVVGLSGAVVAAGPYLPLGPDHYRLWAQEGADPSIPLPGRLMFELAPSFRFFSRAQVFVILGLAIAAAAGLLWLHRRLGRRRGLAAALSVLVVAGVAFEYANRPPARVVQTGPTPAVYEWLAARPGQPTVAEYPMAGPAAPRTFYYQFWHREHASRTVNVPSSPESAAFAQSVADITDPSTTSRLAEVGVDYVVVHTDLPPATYPPYQPALPDDSLPADLLVGYPRLERVAELDGAEVYRVLDRAQPSERVAGAVAVGAGFNPPEASAAGPFRWMGDAGEATFTGLAPAGTPAVLEGVAASFAEPRTLTVLAGGRPVGRARIGVDRTDFRIPIRLAGGAQTLELRASPPARTPAEVLGVPDPRPLSLSVYRLEVVAAP